MELMPKLMASRAVLFTPLLNLAMEEFLFDRRGPTDYVRRMAAFLAQLAHESAELRFWHELASGDAYEDRSDLGNTQPGDGPRFKGRGPIQLTGRNNYKSAGIALGLDLLSNPDLAAQHDVGFRVAGWFWRRAGCNELADKDDFRGITKRINGGFNGLAHREAYWEKAKRILNVPPAAPGV